MKVLAAQSCMTLCDPMDCSSGSSAHRVFQARRLESFPSPGIEPRSATLQVDSLQSEPPGKHHSSERSNSKKVGSSIAVVNTLMDIGQEKVGQTGRVA